MIVQKCSMAHRNKKTLPEKLLVADTYIKPIKKS